MNISNNYNYLSMLNAIGGTKTGDSLSPAFSGGTFQDTYLSALSWGNILGINNTSGSRNANNYFNNGNSSASNSDLKTTESMDAIFREASETYGVPLNLIKAVAKAESNFNPDAVSSAGAQGVMQLMPGTAKSLGVTDSFDARSNIMGGTKYLAEKLEKYNGDVELCLAAYNAGSGNVAKYGGIPPFKETQNYVKKVIKYMGQDLSSGQQVSTCKKDAGNSNWPSTGVNGTGQGKNNSYQTGLEPMSPMVASYLLDVMKLQMQMQSISSLSD